MSHVDNHVTVVLVGQHQVDPLVHRHERHLVVDGGLEQGVAAVPRETVGIGDAVSQLPIAGTFNLHRIVQHQLHIARPCHQAHAGEEVVVIAALLGHVYALAVVIGVDVLVAQAHLQLAERQRVAVLGKEDVVALLLLGEGRGDDLLVVDVVVVAVRVVILGAHLQVASPQGP